MKTRAKLMMMVLCLTLVPGLAFALPLESTTFLNSVQLGPSVFFSATINKGLSDEADATAKITRPSGDTFNTDWGFELFASGLTLKTLTIELIDYDLGLGNALFDTDTEVTNNTSRGFVKIPSDFSTLLPVDFQFSDEFSFFGEGGYFSTLLLTFKGSDGILVNKDMNLIFAVDTDEVSHKWGTNPVPEPGTIILLGLGLAGIGLFSRKRMN